MVLDMQEVTPVSCCLITDCVLQALCLVLAGFVLNWPQQQQLTFPSLSLLHYAGNDLNYFILLTMT